MNLRLFTIFSPEGCDALIKGMICSTVKIADANTFLFVREYFALPKFVFPVRARLITERQLAVRAHKLSRDELEAGETEGSSVVVGTHHHGLFSEVRKEI